MTGMEQRSEMVERLSARMVEWEVKIGRLEAKAEAGADVACFEYALAGAVLQYQRNQAAEILRVLTAAGTGLSERLQADAERIQREVGDFLGGITWD